VTHNLGTRLVIIQAYDSGYDEVIPQNIDLTDDNTATITFPTLESGFVVASVGGALSSGNTYITNTGVSTGSFATTGSNTFNGSQTIIGSVTSSRVLTDAVRFNTSAGVSVGVGELAWNNSDGTLDLGMKGGAVVQQIGQEIFYEVRNETGTPIDSGTLLYANGVTAGSGRITATPYTADGSVREVRLLGMATETISTGVNGFVTHFGYVRDLDTRGTTASSIAVGDETWAVGDILYAHPTVAGKLTNVRPKHEISVAIVIIRHQSTGVVFVRPTSYGHLEDIHDVSISTGSLASGDLLVYSSTLDYWQNSKQLTGSYGLTGSLSATSLTGSLFGTASFATTASHAQGYVLNSSTSSLVTTSTFNTYTSSLKTVGTWTVPAGASVRSFTVDWNHSYQMWVNGNIPNGIITWNATVNVTNANVPVVGSQYGWYYVGGNALVLTSIPSQIVGQNGAISTANVPTTTANTFEFGITNNSGTTQTISYGYIKVS
jgi:hypothetical protein